MNRKDISEGDVLAYTTRLPRNPDEQDDAASPVRVIDPGREVPVYARRRMGQGTGPPRQIGTETVIIVQALTPHLTTLDGEEFAVKPRHLIGLWYDRIERVNSRLRAQRESDERREARRETHRARFDEVGDLSSNAITRGLLHEPTGEVRIGVDNLLALIKAARTAALNEYEGTGGRNV